MSIEDVLTQEVSSPLFNDPQSRSSIPAILQCYFDTGCYVRAIDYMETIVDTHSLADIPILQMITKSLVQFKDSKGHAAYGRLPLDVWFQPDPINPERCALLGLLDWLDVTMEGDLVSRIEPPLEVNSLETRITSLLYLPFFGLSKGKPFFTLAEISKQCQFVAPTIATVEFKLQAKPEEKKKCRRRLDFNNVEVANLLELDGGNVFCGSPKPVLQTMPSNSNFVSDMELGIDNESV